MSYGCFVECGLETRFAKLIIGWVRLADRIDVVPIGLRRISRFYEVNSVGQAT